MRHQSIPRRAADASDAAACSEPEFELPPLLSARPERRLTARATAGFPDAPLPHEFRANAVTLDLGGPDGIAVAAVGEGVGAVFGLGVGPLAVPPLPADGEGRTLAALLRDACTVLRVRRAPLPFEGVVATPHAACVMLRGVLLPLGRGARAEAVLSWKQVLDADATARLRAELLQAMARARRSRPAEAFAPHLSRGPAPRALLALPL